MPHVSENRGVVKLTLNETEKRALELARSTAAFVARNLPSNEQDRVLLEASLRAAEALKIMQEAIAKRNTPAPAVDQPKTEPPKK